MMLRIRQAECTQMMGDLRQKIAELEVQVMPLNIPLRSPFVVIGLESRTDQSRTDHGRSRSSG